MLKSVEHKCVDNGEDILKPVQGEYRKLSEFDISSNPTLYMYVIRENEPYEIYYYD